MKKLMRHIVIAMMLFTIIIGIPLIFPYKPKADIDGPHKAEDSRELDS